MLIGPRDSKEYLHRQKVLLVVPTYQNVGTIGSLMADLIKYAEDILVVDDGCTDNTLPLLQTFGFQTTDGSLNYKRSVLVHQRNMGKGRSLKDAFILAEKAGYRYVLTIDADGQHFASDIPVFVEAMMSGPDTLWVGARNLQSENMPGKNTFANRFSNFWFRLETCIRLEDTQCGYRLYPLDGKTRYSAWYYTSLYEFELEAIVFTAWNGTPVKNVPVRVYYPPVEERVSHFKPFRDFTRISILNTLLVLACLLYVWPRNLIRSISFAKIRKFFDENLFHVKDSNRKLTFSFWLGVFIGLLPFGGYHFVTAVFLAHILKLNTLVSGAFTLISIAPLMPFLIFASCWTGSLLLGHPLPVFETEINFAALRNMVADYVIGGIVFAATVSSAAAGICALLLRITRPKGIV